MGCNIFPKKFQSLTTSLSAAMRKSKWLRPALANRRLRVLFHPVKPDIPQSHEIVWCERDGIRIIILTNPKPNSGAKLVKTAYRIEPQANAHKLR
jgi:hypothetical protein